MRPLITSIILISIPEFAIAESQIEKVLREFKADVDRMSDEYGELPAPPNIPGARPSSSLPRVISDSDLKDRAIYEVIQQTDSDLDFYRNNFPEFEIEEDVIENSIENEQSFPFRLPESQLQSNLSGQSTGLASPLGDARTQRDAEELRQVLATTPDGPFVATVESPSGTSTGGFTGEEGLNIAGVLNVFAFDSGQLQDGDRVRLTVRDSRGVVLNQTITLTFGGRTSGVSTTRGLVNVTITALNEGTEPPNTGGLRVSGDVAGNRNGNFDLNVGQSGTLAVRVLGN